MMAGTIKFCGGVITAVLAVIFVRQAKSEMHTVVGITAAVAAAIYCISLVTGFGETLKNAAERFGLEGNDLLVPFKIVGICLVCDFTADFCREAGLSALANNTELAGKLAVAAVTLPMAVELLEVTVMILGG